MRALVAGWFSYPEMGATAGDIHARDVVVRWLRDAGCPVDLAVAPPFTDGIDWRTADPAKYSHLVFVCGPFGKNEATTELLAKFRHCNKIGVNLSMLQHLAEWNPFDLLLERDSSRASRADISFLEEQEHVPIVGMILVKPQKEYGKLGRHKEAKKALYGLTKRRRCAIVPIDTRLDCGENPLRNAIEVESMIARMDLVLTTRLHGTVLALKNGVPAVTIDPIKGGAKIRAQLRKIDWPICFDAEALNPDLLDKAFDWAMTEAARRKARQCTAAAIASLGEAEKKLLRHLQRHPAPIPPNC